MVKKIGLIVLIYFSAFSQNIQNIEKYRSVPGPFVVKAIYLDWNDITRNRIIPVKIYYPEEIKNKIPAIIFSHGLGGNREAGREWGEHWASYGYISVHLQHPGSDSEILKNLKGRPGEKMKQIALAANAKNAIDRVMDVKFAIDQLSLMNKKDSLFKDKMDLMNIGMSGHSFGAATTLMVSGQVFVGKNNNEIIPSDKRIKSSIAFSPPVGKSEAPKEKVYGKIEIPFYTLTGTDDNSPINDTKAGDRRIPFDNMKSPDKFLVTFKDGDHMVFSGQTRIRGTAKNDDFIHEQIRMSTIAFWDSYLKNLPEAKKWLVKGGFEQTLKDGGLFEKK
jgi:predicted dienelactone hydrolase